MCFSFISSFFKQPKFRKERFDITPIIINGVIIECGYDSKSLSSLDSLSNMLNTLSSRNEVSMLLAHIFHETGGLMYNEEQNPDNRYFNEIKKQSYHGRGYLMLSYIYNYHKASNELGLGDRLVNNPDLVKEDKYAVETTYWYWKKVVLKNTKVCDTNFGESTIEINGNLEGTDEGKEMARHRFELYKKIATYLKVDKIATK